MRRTFSEERPKCSFGHDKSIRGTLRKRWLDVGIVRQIVLYFLSGRTSQLLLGGWSPTFGCIPLLGLARGDSFYRDTAHCMLYWRESNPEPEDSNPHVLRARETHSHAGNQVSFTSSPGQTFTGPPSSHGLCVRRQFAHRLEYPEQPLE